MRFPYNHDHLSQRGSSEARQEAPTPPSPTVMMTQFADDGGREGEWRGNEDGNGDGDEDETKECFNDLTTRATDKFFHHLMKKTIRGGWC